MLKLKSASVNKFCLTLLSLSLLTTTVFGLENDNASYLDSVTPTMAYTSTESILNLTSDDAKGFETTLRLDSSAPITKSNAKVNLSLRDSDLKQALRMLAQKAGVNIVFDESVDGKITLDLNNISVNDAFAVIFKSSQLTYTVDGNTLTVMTLDAAKDVAYTRQTMTVLPVRYVNSENVAEFLNENLFKSNIFGLSSKPVVTANPRTNQIVIFGTQQDVIAIKRVLPVLDTKPMVNTFKVSHTTPKEMAALICDSLFYTSENGNSSTVSTSSSTNAESDEVILGGGTIACRDRLESGSSSGTEEGLATFKTNPMTVTYFPELGQIGVYGGSVEQVEVIKQFIKDHDKKQLMAYVELSVIELNESGSKEFSNEWNLWTPFVSLSFTPDSGLQTSSENPLFVWGSQYKVNETTTSGEGSSTSERIVTKSNNKALVYRLKYLVENGNGRVLTNPKIMVTSGRKAVIDMTSDYVKSVTSQVLQSSNAITAATQKTYDIGSDEGLKIEIVPFISPDGYVSMNITPEFATIKQQLTSKNENNEEELAATLLQRRDLELKNIRIKDGETLVLAGLIKENETQTVRKMPFLSDLPFIGVFFRGNTTRTAREELVIVVTPHIVKDTADAMSGQYDL